MAKARQVIPKGVHHAAPRIATVTTLAQLYALPWVKEYDRPHGTRPFLYWAKRGHEFRAVYGTQGQEASVLVATVDPPSFLKPLPETKA